MGLNSIDGIFSSNIEGTHISVVLSSGNREKIVSWISLDQTFIKSIVLDILDCCRKCEHISSDNKSCAGPNNFGPLVDKRPLYICPDFQSKK